MALIVSALDPRNEHSGVASASMDLDLGPCACHFPMCLSKTIYLRHRNQGDLLQITWQPLPNPRYPGSKSTLVPETTLTSSALITHCPPVLICLNVTYAPQRLLDSRFDQLSDLPPGPLFLIGNMQTFEYLREYNDLESLGVQPILN